MSREGMGFFTERIHWLFFPRIVTSWQVSIKSGKPHITIGPTYRVWGLFIKERAAFWAIIPESPSASVWAPAMLRAALIVFALSPSLQRFVAQSQIPVLLWNRNNICDTGTNSRWMAGSADQQLNFASAFNCLQKLFIALCTPPRQHYLLNKHVVPGWQGRGAYQVSRNKYGRMGSCTWVSFPSQWQVPSWLFSGNLCHQMARPAFQPHLGLGQMTTWVIAFYLVATLASICSVLWFASLLTVNTP